MTKVKARSEHLEQKEVVQYFRGKWPELKLCIWSCPNGFVAGGRNKHAGINKLKSEGYTVGVADLQIAIPNRGFFGMFIEMKKADGKESDVKPEQVAFIEAMRGQGYCAIVCYGAKDAIKMIDEYME